MVKLKPASMDVLMQDVLHIITGKMLSSSEDYEMIFDVLRYMLDERIDHQNYSRALEYGRRALIKQHPKLANYESAEFDPERLIAWLKSVYRDLGLKSEYMKVAPCTDEEQARFQEEVEAVMELRRPPKKTTPKVDKGLLRFDDEF